MGETQVGGGVMGLYEIWRWLYKNNGRTVTVNGWEGVVQCEEYAQEPVATLHVTETADGVAVKWEVNIPLSQVTYFRRRIDVVPS